MGSTHLADFVTGRSIQETDPAVAIVIVPASGGYPDPVVAAASPPLYPHERYKPLSFPLTGRVDDGAAFIADPGFRTDLLLDVAGFRTWKEFISEATDFGKAFELRTRRRILGGDVRKTVAGFAVMHLDTYEHLIVQSGIPEARHEAVEAMVRIDMDARTRRGEQIVGVPFRDFTGSLIRTYETAGGESIAVPHLGRALGTNGRCDMAEEAIAVLAGRYGSEAPNVGEADLREIYGAIHDLQHLSYGMFRLNRHIVPSSNAGGRDNAFLVMEQQISSIAATLESLPDRKYIGPGWDDHFADKAVALRERLEGLLEMARELAPVDEASPMPSGP